MRTKYGSQNADLHENKRWFSKRWYAREQKVALKMLGYTRKRDGSQNFGLQKKSDGSPVCLHENKRWLSKLWFT
jgi:hypothetical protein